VAQRDELRQLLVAAEVNEVTTFTNELNNSPGSLFRQSQNKVSVLKLLTMHIRIYEVVKIEQNNVSKYRNIN